MCSRMWRPKPKRTASDERARYEVARASTARHKAGRAQRGRFRTYISNSKSTNRVRREMPRTPARTTQADVARAIRAAKKEGASAVEVRPDGTLIIRLAPLNQQKLESEATPEDTIVL